MHDVLRLSTRRLGTSTRIPMNSIGGRGVGREGKSQPFAEKKKVTSKPRIKKPVKSFYIHPLLEVAADTQQKHVFTGNSTWWLQVLDYDM